MSSAVFQNGAIVVSCDACSSKGVSPMTKINPATKSVDACPWCKAPLNVAVEGLPQAPAPSIEPA